MSWMNELRESIVKVREERVKSGIARKKNRVQRFSARILSVRLTQFD